MGLLAACVGFNNPDGWAPAEVADDTLYVTLDGGKLSAVDPNTLNVIWEFPPSDDVACGNEEPQKRDLKGIYASPVVREGIVYFGAWDGIVYALDATTGDCVWDFETDGPIIGGLVLANGLLISPSSDGNLYALDPATGNEERRANVGEVWARPALSDGVLYVANVDGDLRALDALTLEEVWDHPFSVNTGFLTDPALLNGTVVVGGLGNNLYGVDAETGAERWSFEDASNWYWGRPLTVGDTVYATSLDSRVFALDGATGERLWQFDGVAPIRAGVVISGGVLIAVDDNGNVYGMDPETGIQVWVGPTEIDKKVLADPYVLADDSVMIVTTGGDTFTVSPEDGRLTTVEIR
ncbi:MAG: PQQ-binding-like beta-propeller repeat protein [Chloroflexi bacterium]|nr:PQQ-binding-like beta-propeller repeat protein [Chloroflexota bacterium]